MIIVKMNETTVECSIAASELHEIGLTPEAVINGAENTTSFFAQLNKEVGAQLDYDPETEVMMMSKNMMMDGSVRIFAVKMSNDDIQKAADRIRGAAETILRTLTQEKVDEVKLKTGKEKGVALNEVITNVTDTINRIYGREPEAPEAPDESRYSYQPLTEYAKYMMEFTELNQAERFAKVIQRLPIVDSTLYKHDGKFYLLAGLMSADESIIYDMRRAGVEYSDMILNSEQALSMYDDNTVLVVVDVNRPSYTECPELLEVAKTKVLFDHHRQTSDSINDAVLSYIEPYISSACEMVTEMLQYVGDGLKLKTIEAEAMYSGIMIDTNNFTTKTGVRTFEAAAFLKRCGADVTRIRKAFRTDMDEYIAKARAISTAEIYLGGFVLADCVAESVGSPTVLGAQVANELMDINGVKASFVFTEYNNQIYISARSIDEVNVQIIMEKLGGGGHMSVAGAQLSCSKEEAKQKVRDVLKEMSENKEI